MEADPERLSARNGICRKRNQFTGWPADIAKRDHSGIGRLTKQPAKNPGDLVRRDDVDQRKFE